MASDDLSSSVDGLKRRTKSRGETSSRRIASIFTGRKKRKQSTSRPDTPHANGSEDSPPNSLELAKSVASSLLTDDEGAASFSSSPAKRPGFSPHPSHTALLTLSSPLIASRTIDPTRAADSNSNNSISSSTSSHIQPAKPIHLEANKHTASPVAKRKGAFAPTRLSIPTNPAGNSESAASSSRRGGRGSLFGGKKKEPRPPEQPIYPSTPQPPTGEGSQSHSASTSFAPQSIITPTPAPPPNLVHAPTTLVTPPTPTDIKQADLTDIAYSKPDTSQASQSISHEAEPLTGNAASHKRVRSIPTISNKPAHATIAPLTPHPEEVKTPGGTAVHPSTPGGGGFFASIFTVAQNAATNVTDTITNIPIGRNRNSQPSQKDSKKSEEPSEGVSGLAKADLTADGAAEKPRPAVETLGSGNLSLAHLGILDNSDVSVKKPTVSLTRVDTVAAKLEDMAAAQAVSAAYAADKSPSVNGERPRSMTGTSEQSGAGATSPPRPNELESPSQSTAQRQGSIRSRISGGRRRRPRGSSATTNKNGMGASTSTLAPSATMNGSRLSGTGFAVAPPRRNRDFHNLFKSVPEDDYLIEDYSAALQKEILLHGRLYVSEGHLCFSSNILGWVTNLVISFDEVVSVEKKSTAVVFPNAIVISTLHARNVFASLLSRDSTYDLIVGIWKISHPNLKSSLNGIALSGSGTGDKTEKAESVGSDVGSSQGSDEDVYDEDAEEDDDLSFAEAGETTMANSAVVATSTDASKLSSAIAQAVDGGGESTEGAKAVTNGATNGQDFPGPLAHTPTECGDHGEHYDKLLIDTTIPAPLGKVYSLMFGPASGAFMRKWLIDDQKSSDLQMEDDKKGLCEEKKIFDFSYIKPLTAPVGPRQTKCNINMVLEQFDLDRVVTVNCSTGTPDVPNGNMFLTKTRYCLMWGPGNSTRLIMTFTVEWSGKSWLRGPIEKGANDGQMSYATSLTATLRTAVMARATPLKLSGKGGKSKKRSKTETEEIAAPAPVAAPAAVKQSDWGLLDPLRSLLGPVADIIDMVLAPRILVPLMGCLLLYSWFFRSAPAAVTTYHKPMAQRGIAYEDMWRHEESELWNWLEDRVALDRVHSAIVDGKSNEECERRQLKPENMKDREMDEAIMVTEKRLKALKDAVDRKRSESKSKRGKVA